MLCVPSTAANGLSLHNRYFSDSPALEAFHSIAGSTENFKPKTVERNRYDVIVSVLPEKTKKPMPDASRPV